MAFPAFFFHLFLLIWIRVSPSILVSWSIRISGVSIFRRSFTALAFVGFPIPLQFQETSHIIYYDWEGLILPWEALFGCFSPLTFQLLLGCPAFFASLASLLDFPPAVFLVAFSNVSSFKDHEGSGGFFLATSV